MPASREAAIENRLWSLDEALPRSELRTLQLQRLSETLQRAERVPHYQDAFNKTGIASDKIKSLDDIRRLPLTTKDDLRRNYPFGMLAIPRSELARVHCSTGTTGKPTVVGYTAADIETWSDLCARFLVAGGLKPDHMVHVAFGYGLFTGGFGLHYGIERVGASVVPASSGNTERQVMLMRDFQADALICTPSYALNIAEVAREGGMDPRELSLSIGHFGAEPWTEEMRNEIEMQLGVYAFNNYGLSEIMGPGVSGECFMRNGMHIQEDHFLVECLDPNTLEPVSPGEQGELVITNLTKQAMPVIRYRTRDICTLDDTPCVCGRTGIRMGRIIGRSDDMLIIRGVNVYPSQIEEALLKIEGTAPHYAIEVDRPGTLDEMTVRVEMRATDFSDMISQVQALRERIQRAIHNITGLYVHVELVKPQTLERFTGKARRVFDKRKNKRL